MRARGDRAKEIDLGDEFEIIALFRGRWLREVAAVTRKPGDLKHVQVVVDVELGQVIGNHRTGQVRVAAKVELVAVEQLVNIRVAARPEEIVAPRAIRVDAVVNGFVDDRRHRTQKRQARPETIEGRHMRGMQLLGSAGPETFAGIVKIPQVEVRDLRSLRQRDPADLACGHNPRFSRALRHDDVLFERPSVDALAEWSVDRPVDVKRHPGLRLVEWLGFAHDGIASRLAVVVSKSSNKNSRLS